jgi:hypothetical protein
MFVSEKRQANGQRRGTGDVEGSSVCAKAVQIASITHGWGEKEKNPNAILNPAILTGLERLERSARARKIE